MEEILMEVIKKLLEEVIEGRDNEHLSLQGLNI